MALGVNQSQETTDYVRSAIESGMATPPLYTVEGELGRPNIQVTAPTTNTNQVLTWLVVGLVIWWIFFRKGKR